MNRGVLPVRPAGVPDALPGRIRVFFEKGKIARVSYRGCADLESLRPMDERTVCWMASNGKTVTCAAFMLLVEEGAAGLDDPVTRFLPYMNHFYRQERDRIVPVRTPVTLRHLLSHTSGLAFIPSSGFQRQELTYLPLETQTRIFSGSLLLSEPGTRYSYSNAGPDTIGRIIEVISGMDYERYMKNYVFEPLEMTDTGYRLNREQIARLSKGYKYADGAWQSVVCDQMSVLPFDSPDRYPECGGGLFSTAEDFSHFALMLANKGIYNGRRLLAESTLREMCRKQTPEGEKDYGLCCLAGSLGHGGAWGTQLKIDMDRGSGELLIVQKSGEWPPEEETGQPVWIDGNGAPA